VAPEKAIPPAFSHQACGGWKGAVFWKPAAKLFQRYLSVIGGRLHTRRFTRLTNAFSKKVENHAHSVALFAMYCNFVRIHKTLRTAPAMAAGVTSRLWEIGDIVGVLEAWEASNDWCGCEREAFAPQEMGESWKYRHHPEGPNPQAMVYETSEGVNLNGSSGPNKDALAISFLIPGGRKPNDTVVEVAIKPNDFRTIVALMSSTDRDATLQAMAEELRFQLCGKSK
jgi:hypothetical protein